MLVTSPMRWRFFLEYKGVASKHSQVKDTRQAAEEGYYDQ